MFPLDITFPGRTSTVVMVWKDKNMRKTRIGALVASSALAGATLFGGAGIALAADTGPVTFDAVKTGECEVTFTVTNETNSEHYQIDYQINGEFDGNVEGYQTWDEAGHNAVEDYEQGAEGETRWGPTSKVEAGVPVRGEGVGYTTDNTATDSTLPVNLNDLEDLPEADEDGNYEIEYRLIWGPHTPHRFDGDDPRTLTLDNCELDPDEGGIFDSIFGSIDFFDNPGGGLSS